MREFNLQNITWEATRILKMHSPVRDWRVYSKYGPPGNLKNNGIRPKIQKHKSKIIIGGEPAPYAPFTETRSRRKGWMKKSYNRLTRVITTVYGGIRK